MYTLRQRSNSGFTLIELLVVISIIGLLASIILAALNSGRAKARDANRQETLHQLQTALELYATANNGNYPATFSGTSPSFTAAYYWSICSDFGSHTTSGSNGYIPNLAPTYIPALPTDPSGKSCGSSYGTTYLYVSNGTDYMLLAYGTVETYTSSTNPEKRPAVPAELDFAVYTSGAAGW